jgi:hypothetical protein
MPSGGSGGVYRLMPKHVYPILAQGVAGACARPWASPSGVTAPRSARRSAPASTLAIRSARPHLRPPRAPLRPRRSRRLPRKPCRKRVTEFFTGSAPASQPFSPRACGRALLTLSEFFTALSALRSFSAGGEAPEQLRYRSFLFLSGCRNFLQIRRHRSPPTPGRHRCY